MPTFGPTDQSARDAFRRFYQLPMTPTWRGLVVDDHAKTPAALRGVTFFWYVPTRGQRIRDESITYAGRPVFPPRDHERLIAAHRRRAKRNAVRSGQLIADVPASRIRHAATATACAVAALALVIGMLLIFFLSIAPPPPSVAADFTVWLTLVGLGVVGFSLCAVFAVSASRTACLAARVRIVGANLIEPGPTGEIAEVAVGDARPHRAVLTDGSRVSIQDHTGLLTASLQAVNDVAHRRRGLTPAPGPRKLSLRLSILTALGILGVGVVWLILILSFVPQGAAADPETPSPFDVVLGFAILAALPLCIFALGMPARTRRERRLARQRLLRRLGLHRHGIGADPAR